MVPFALTGVVEGVALFGRVIGRRDLFVRARDRADAIRRPLVVVGAPDWSGNHPCGDVCVDAHGCPDCGARPADVERVGGIPLGKDSAVVFVSRVFERSRDIDAAWREVERVGGSMDNIFVSHVQPWASWTSVAHPDIRWVVLEAPPQFKRFKRRPLCRQPYDVTKVLVHR